jgi:predicted cobalt transporter CbtA
MVATRKYKEIYDIQASRRKATWFIMQKLVVNNYALGILVLRSQHPLKILTSIASRSHTVTDPQPNKTHFDKPTKPNQTHLRFHLIM